ncbi:MAG TPA: lipopolysaccharide heptosyltransferase II [Gemmatimonadales bacterium]|nr:lipopolysaccharide heptosyltransferase II [Gemmatimonadales bacterium]
MSSLVIQTAFLGDVVLTTPLLDAVAARDGAPVDVVTTKTAAPLLETHPSVRRVFSYDKHGADRGIGGLTRLARALARERYRAAYLPHRSLRSALAAVLARIPRRVGFDDGWRVLYTESRPRAKHGQESDRLLGLVDAPRGKFPIRLYPPPAALARALAFLGAAGITGDFIAVAPGSIWGTKRWPYYDQLAAELAARTAVVAIGGGEDRALCDQVLAGMRRTSGAYPVANAAGELSLLESTALLAQARLLVTNDTAPLHLATAVDTPVVALFGPTVPSFGFAPVGPEDMVLEVDGLSCRPCSTHGPRTCPLGHHRCLRDLSVARVLTAIENVRALHRRH